jgi:ArsR family transcriptional regulator
VIAVNGVLILVKIDICQYSSAVKRHTDPDVLLLQAAADPTRLAILRELSDSAEVCACNFTACCDVSQPTVSHHLKVLRDAGWIEGERRGTWIWYSLRPGAVERFRELAGAVGPSVALPATSRRLPVVEGRA